MANPDTHPVWAMEDARSSYCGSYSAVGINAQAAFELQGPDSRLHINAVNCSLQPAIAFHASSRYFPKGSKAKSCPRSWSQST